MLCGFHVTDDFAVVEISVHGCEGGLPSCELSSEICAALEDLIADSEDSIELLRGRTFARALH